MSEPAAASVDGSGSPASQRTIFARLVVLMATGCLDLMGMLMVAPQVPFYTKRMGGSDTLVGVMLGAHAFAMLVTAPLWGRLSDRYGRRPVILLGLVTGGVAFLVYAVTDNLWVLLLSRLAQGAGAGTIGVVQAYISDTVEPKQRVKALGWFTAATSAGVMVGPVVGSLTTRWGLHAPGFVAAGLALLNVSAAFFLLPEPPRSTSLSVRRHLRHAIADVFRRPLLPAHRMIWIYTAGMMAFMAMNGVLALFLNRRFGVTAGTIGYYYLYIGGIGLLMRGGLLGRLVDRLGDLRVLRYGALSIALGQLLVPFAGSVPVLVAVIALVPIGTAMLFPATTAQVSRHAPAGHVGEFMGLQQAMGGVSRVLGPVWAGAVFQHLGVSWPFWIAATLMAAVGALAWGAVTGEGAEAGQGVSAVAPPVSVGAGATTTAEPLAAVEAVAAVAAVEPGSGRKVSA
jgi:MFS family permease